MSEAVNWRTVADDLAAALVGCDTDIMLAHYDRCGSGRCDCADRVAAVKTAIAEYGRAVSQ